MQMASSFLLSLSILVLLSFSSAYARKWFLPNGVNQNPIKIIETAVGVSEDLPDLNGMEAKDKKSKYIIVGPWGDEMSISSNYRTDFDDGAHTGVREINLSYNNETAIGDFQVIYDSNGTPLAGKNHTSQITDFTSAKISLDFPHEYIIGVSGYYGDVHGHIVIRSLKFKTNHNKTYGPYGAINGTPFSLPIENGFVIGFKGSIGYWMDFFGIYLGL